MTLMKNIRAIILLVALTSVCRASGLPPTDDFAALPKDTKKLAAERYVGLIDNADGTAQILNISPRLVKFLQDVDPASYDNAKTKELLYGVKELYSFLITNYANDSLEQFIAGLSSLSPREVTFGEFILDTKQGFLGISAKEIDRVGTAIAAVTGTRISEYGRIGVIEDMRAVSQLEMANKISQTRVDALGSTTATVDAVKSTAVSVPSPVVAIDPTLPTVLLDDATLEDAMAVLLVKKTDHPSGVMYDIAFDSSILLGLLPENTKARETLRTLDPLLARFTNPTVRTFIEGMRQIYLEVMGRVYDSYDKAAFAAVLNQLNVTSRSLVVPFKLNPSSQYSLDQGMQKRQENMTI